MVDKLSPTPRVLRHRQGCPHRVNRAAIPVMLQYQYRRTFMKIRVVFDYDRSVDPGEHVQGKNIIGG